MGGYTKDETKIILQRPGKSNKIFWASKDIPFNFNALKNIGFILTNLNCSLGISSGGI